MVDGASYDALDKAVSDIAEDGLAKYLMDADLSRAAVDYLHEFGIPKLAGKLLVRGIAQLVEWSAKSAGSKVYGIVKARLRRLPYYDKLEKGIDRLTAYLKGEIKNAAGKTRPRHDQDFAKSLTESFQDSLEGVATVADLQDVATQLIDRLAPQPKLFLNLFDAEGEEGFNRFYYGSRKIAFVGREDEMARLDGFLDHDSPFRWWLIHGPAGFGKSRLALELCLRRGGSWRVGFLPYEHTARDVDRWIPDEPILLVADYASGQERAKELGRTIRDLSRRSGEFPFPVRLLLLERDAGDWWLDRLRESGGDRLETDRNRHEEPMPLGGLSDDGLRRVMQAFGLAEARTADLLPELREMDPEGRPLFAALMADAVAGGRPQSQLWRAKEELIGDVLDREEERFWKPAGITNADKNLLALATLCGGVGLTDLNDLPEGRGLLGGHNASRYRVMSGRDASERLAPLEPDILGEWFVLHHLQPGDVLDERLEDMRNLAWRMAPYGMAVFLDRASRDFPRHDAFQTIATAPAEGNLAAVLWALVAVNLIGRLAASDPDAAVRWYGDIQTLAANHPKEPALREQQAKAANNLIADLAASDSDAAARWYGEIQTLAAKHPKEEALREQQANAATNLINRLAASDLVAGARWYGDIQTLAAKHPKEEVLREKQASAAFNLISRFAASDPDAAARWYGDIQALAAKHPEEEALREKQANAAINLIGHFAASDPVAAARWYGDIQTLAAKHPKEKTLRESQAKAANNLIADLAASDSDAAARWYGEIQTLAA
ncbi:MAG: hypothetical protein QF583_07375, partial [Rhodospirillales bacterium]|nr:hypothetical protein [Rhodospirillales bacterium]